MKYLSRVEAIHPRGARTKTKVQRRGGISSRSGKTIISKLDWIAGVLGEMIDDYNFPPKTNKLLHQARSLHGLVTDSMKLGTRLKAYGTFVGMLDAVGKEIQRLYRSGDLSADVDRKVLHNFLATLEEAKKNGGEILQAMQEFEDLKGKLNKLGLEGEL